MIRQRAKFAKSDVQSLLLSGDMFNRRLQAQQTVLFNLIAQEDSRANLSIAADSKQLAADSKRLAEYSIELAAGSRELAAASKRDSSAMKIIAYMTTLFLPATFVSTLFSMPMFDWTVPRISDAAGGHMWFYWTIAIPLTVLVVSVFGVYAWYQGRKNKVIAQKAREGADKKVKDV
ncbi:hypothetical protein QBC43DRAFT_31872 [Cladorrhinum sp. PSN259]|nr:hypothetical protein QBC43DRAFT_31872 [Cladorrhinum sp. PSN259]